MPRVDYRENSRLRWHRNVVEGKTEIPDTDVIQLGCLLRIADGVEAMAQSYSALIRERNHLAHQNECNDKVIQRLVKSNAALRGHLKRVKRGAK